jgi:hypothetical protein
METEKDYVKMLQPMGSTKIIVLVRPNEVEKLKKVGWTLAPKPKAKPKEKDK